MSAEILMAVGEANLAAGAAICAVLLARKPVRRLFGARVAYRLWLAAPLAAAASLLPARTVMVAQAPVVMEPVVVDVSASAAVTTIAQTAPLIGSPAVMALWLAGAATSFAILAWSQSRFMKSLGGVVREGKYLRARAAGTGPAVLGALFPRIVLPADFETRYDAREQEVVLAHERAHLASGDAAVNAATAFAQCLFWFNPLVHIAALVMRVDQELACDAAVLAAYPAERRPYAEALLKTQIAATPLPLGCYWPAGASNPLKERIAMLKFQTPSRARRLSGGAGVLALCLGAGFAAWAAQPAQLVEAPASNVAETAALVEVRAAVQEQIARAEITPGATRSASAGQTSPTAADAAPSIAESPAGRTFARVDAPPSPPRRDIIMVTAADGRIRTILLPRPPLPYRGSEAAKVDAPEPESVRAARLTLAAAEADHAARTAAGRPPQPLTPELEDALRIVRGFYRERLRQSMEENRARQAALITRAREVDPTGAKMVEATTASAVK